MAKIILFAQDWAKYPDARPNFATKNTSFVRLAAVYRSMGVKNHAFLLALIDQKLLHVDPHDPDITFENQLRVAVECKNNPWYFFREVARVPAIGGTEPTMFEASRGNIAAYWMFFNHITFFLIQPRQTGKSFAIDTLQSLLLNVICTNTKINLLTKDDKLRRENIIRLKAIMDVLPPYLYQKSSDDAANTEEITIKRLKNSYSTHVPRASEKDADKVGRGLTTGIMHVDEPPFQSHIKVTLDAALGAMGAAIEKSKAAGAPWGTMFTTTAGKQDDRDGKEVYDMLMKSAVWTEIFFDARDEKHLNDLIKTNSRGGVVRVAAVFNHRQLGKTDEWMRETLGRINPSPDAANRDFFNMWTAGSLTNPLPQHLLTRISASKKEVQYSEISPIRNYITRWYIPFDEIDARMARGRFVMALDTSDASGGDDISFVLIDIETLEVVAATAINETNLITFSDWLAQWFVRFTNFTCIIERKSSGVAILDALMIKLPEYGIDPFRRLFNTVVQDYLSDPDAYSEAVKPLNRKDYRTFDKFKKKFGYTTSSTGTYSRDNLYAQIRIAAEKGCDGVNDSKLIDQIVGLIEKNGRIDHAADKHDDMVIAWLLCVWFLTQGVNMSYYGINSRDIMSKVDKPKVMDPVQEAFEEEQNALRDRIDVLTDRIAGERDEFIAMNLEGQVRALMPRVVYRENEGLSIDEMIRQAKERRKKKNTLNNGSKYGYNTPPTMEMSGYGTRPGMVFDRGRHYH